MFNKPILYCNYRRLTLVPFIFLMLLTTSCSGLITSRIIEPTVGNLQKQTDIELVCEGAPAYLLMIDSMIASDPTSKGMLQVGAQSYSGYLGALKECDPETDRLPAIAQKAHDYGVALINQYIPLDTDSDEIDKKIANLSKKDVPPLFWGTLAWITWIQQQNGAPSAMADLVIVEKIMNRILELSPDFQGGGAHLFMGGYYASIPAMFGGKPEVAKQHFEEALAIADRKFLLTQVTYAEKYARMTMNKELHNALLQEVVDFPIDSAPEFGLSNQIAKKKAIKLLDDDYFLD